MIDPQQPSAHNAPMGPHTDAPSGAVQVCAIGIDVGGTNCAGGIVHGREGRIRARRLEPTRPERGGQAVLDDVVRLVRSLQEEALRLGAQPAAVGVGVAELIDRQQRVVSSATIGWRDLPVRDAIQAATGLGVRLDADVRAAARGEALLGAGRGVDSYLYLTVGTGISACLVIHSEPYAGARGLTGTFASSRCLIADDQSDLVGGPPLEQFASGPALAARYAALAPGFGGAAPEVVALAEAGDPRALSVVESGGRALGAAVANLVNMLDPEFVVLGGGLGLATGPYRRAMAESLRECVWSDLHRMVQVLDAKLGLEAGWIGAALGALSDLKSGDASC